MSGRRVVATAVLLSGVAACAGVRQPSPRSAAIAPAVSTSSACQRTPPSCVGSPPTYTADVRPILDRHCFKCHAGDGVAADEHDFSHVETLRAQRNAFVSQVSACAMPPSSETPMPDADASMLLRWVACGAIDGAHP